MEDKDNGHQVEELQRTLTLVRPGKEVSIEVEEAENTEEVVEVMSNVVVAENTEVEEVVMTEVTAVVIKVNNNTIHVVAEEAVVNTNSRTTDVTLRPLELSHRTSSSTMSKIQRRSSRQRVDADTIKKMEPSSPSLKSSIQVKHQPLQQSLPRRTDSPE